MTKIESQPIHKAALSTREAIVYLGISLPTIHRLVKAGQIKYLRIGRSLRFRVEDLDEFLRDRVTKKWKRYNPKKKTPAVHNTTPETPKGE